VICGRTCIIYALTSVLTLILCMSAFILSIVSFNYNSTGEEGRGGYPDIAHIKEEGWGMGGYPHHAGRLEEAAHITGERKTCMCQVRIQCWLYTSVEDLRTINNDKLWTSGWSLNLCIHCLQNLQVYWISFLYCLLPCACTHTGGLSDQFCPLCLFMQWKKCRFGCRLDC